MKTRTIASAAVALFTALALSGCISASTETTDGPTVDASTRGGSCQIIDTDLAEYTAGLAKSAHGLTDYTPSTMLSFQKGAVEKLTSVSQKLEHDGVKDALLAVRDTSTDLVPILEKLTENPDTWADGSLDADIAAANEAAIAALDELGEVCPEVTQLAP